MERHEDKSPSAQSGDEGQRIAHAPLEDVSLVWVMDTHHGGAHEDYGRDGMSYE